VSSVVKRDERIGPKIAQMSMEVALCPSPRARDGAEGSGVFAEAEAVISACSEFE
jgi:hypothetical protein